MAWNESIMVFFNFFNFFYFFWIFCYASGRNGTERKFLFYLIHILFQPIFARNVAKLVFFLYVEFFGYIFEILCYALGRNKTKRNETKIFISIFLIIFQPILAWNKFIMVFFNFLNFFVIFLEFSITHRVGTKQNDNFYFLSFSAFSKLFWIEMKP